MKRDKLITHITVTISHDTIGGVTVQKTTISSDTTGYNTKNQITHTSDSENILDRVTVLVENE